MLSYVIRDLWGALRFLPVGVGTFAVLMLGTGICNRMRKKKGKNPLHFEKGSCLIAYGAVILMLTFFFRESGTGRMADLMLFSTLRINTRNDAFAAENVLLFVPYGYLLAWNFQAARRFSVCILLGTLTSLFIETMQLITGRGFFQIDDIWTNAAGCVIGLFLYRLHKLTAVLFKGGGVKK